MFNAILTKIVGSKNERDLKKLGPMVQRINELIRGRRGVTPETAWLLSQALGTTPEFWLSLQAAHDLAHRRPARRIGKLRRAS